MDTQDIITKICKQLEDKFVYTDQTTGWMEFHNRKRWRKLPLNVAKKRILDSIKDKHRFIDNHSFDSLRKAMTNSNFLKECDRNGMLVGCENGIFDLEEGIFRDGKPKDYITMSTGIEYKTFSEDDQEVKDLDNFLLKIFPNKHLREYFLDFAALSLSGQENTILIAGGNGNNGRTTTLLLLELVLGDYFGVLSRECLTKNNFEHALIKLRGKRIMKVREGNNKINVGFLNVLTCRRSQLEFLPRLSLIFETNGRFLIGYIGSIWNRIRLLNFESTFVGPNEVVPDTFEKQLKVKKFKADPNLCSETLSKMAPVLLWRLFERIATDTASLLFWDFEPSEVHLATSILKEKNNIYSVFVDECLEKIISPNDNVIKTIDMYSKFKEWFRNCSLDIPTSRFEMIAGLKEILGYYIYEDDPGENFYGYHETKNSWYGYKFIQD